MEVSRSVSSKICKLYRVLREGYERELIVLRHFGEAEDLVWGPQQDVNTTRVMNTVLDNESPQLVVLNGDLITGENTYLSNSTYYVDRIVQPMIQRGLPWASTYGKLLVCSQVCSC